LNILFSLPAIPAHLHEWVALSLAVIIPVVGAILGHKLNQIHVLVNNRLTIALASNSMMKKKLGLKPLPEELAAEEEITRQHHETVAKRKK
jgi:hypothetical protein